MLGPSFLMALQVLERVLSDDLKPMFHRSLAEHLFQRCKDTCYARRTRLSVRSNRRGLVYLGQAVLISCIHIH